METSEIETMTSTAARRFPATPASVSLARGFAAAALPDFSPDEADDLVLLLSELAANAVQHAATEFEVAVFMAPDGRSVRVEVSDGDPGYPVPQRQATDAPHGRGLHIVHALADAWGVEMHRDQPGKTVWFTLPLSGARSAPVAGVARCAATMLARLKNLSRLGPCRRAHDRCRRTQDRAVAPGTALGEGANRHGPSKASGSCSTDCATRLWQPTTGA